MKESASVSAEPRLVRGLCVFRSNKHIYAQIVDDSKGQTLVAASIPRCRCEGRQGWRKYRSGESRRQDRGETRQDKGIQAVLFDRGGYIYHGRVKALAEAAREAGLKF